MQDKRELINFTLLLPLYVNTSVKVKTQNTTKHQQLSEIWQRGNKHEGDGRPLADPTTPASDRCPDALRDALIQPLISVFLPQGS